MRVRWSVLAFGLGIALAAGACGGTGSATTAPAASTGAAASAAATSAPTAAAASQAAGGGATVAGVGSKVPADDGYETFQVYGGQGANALAGATNVSGTDAQALFAATGKSASDFSVAMAVGSKGTTVMALQVNGLPADKFLSLVAGASTANLKDMTVGGKQVKGSVSGDSGQWLYLKDDMIFTVAGTQAAAEAVFKQLP